MKAILKTGLICLTLAGCIGAGENSDMKSQKAGYMPELTGIDLLGKERLIPKSFEGKLNIVAIAFEQEHQTDVNTWIEVADKMIAENKSIRFYEVPLIYKINAAFRMWINNGMRSGIPDEKARERTITVYTDRDKFSNTMEMDLKTIYLLLLDENGKILWRVKGAASKANIKALKDAIAEASAKG